MTFIGRREDRAAFNEYDECPEWIAALNDGGYDYLVTTPAYDQDNPGAATQPVEFLWISNAPEVSRSPARRRAPPRASPTPAQRPAAGDVWQILGPVDPATCDGVPPRGAPTPGLPAD